MMLAIDQQEKFNQGTRFREKKSTTLDDSRYVVLKSLRDRRVIAGSLRDDQQRVHGKNV